jgi:uncharacterized BrkB/YihY/UPF0761 family membrane protein
MNMLTIFVFLAVAAVIVALASGIISMAVNHEVGHVDSAHWMAWRVGLQALAVVLLFMALQKAT